MTISGNNNTASREISRVPRGNVPTHTGFRPPREVSSRGNTYPITVPREIMAHNTCLTGTRASDKYVPYGNHGSLWERPWVVSRVSRGNTASRGQHFPNIGPWWGRLQGNTWAPRSRPPEIRPPGKSRLLRSRVSQASQHATTTAPSAGSPKSRLQGKSRVPRGNRRPQITWPHGNTREYAPHAPQGHGHHGLHGKSRGPTTAQTRVQITGPLPSGPLRKPLSDGSGEIRKPLGETRSLSRAPQAITRWDITAPTGTRKSRAPREISRMRPRESRGPQGHVCPTVSRRP